MDECLSCVLKRNWSSKNAFLRDMQEELRCEIDVASAAWDIGWEHAHKECDAPLISELVTSAASALTTMFGVQVRASVAEYLSASELVSEREKCFRDVAGVVFLSWNNIDASSNEEILSNDMTVFVGLITLTEDLDYENTQKALAAQLLQAHPNLSVTMENGLITVKGVRWCSELFDDDDE
jgi:hypothetical protein